MNDVIGFSARSFKHEGRGLPGDICYKHGTLDSKDWDGKVFTVPEDGVYFISVSFMRDSQCPEGCEEAGTTGDTRIDVFVNGKIIAQAWAGEASVSRVSGATTVLKALKEGDQLSSKDWAEGNEFRRFRDCVLTVFKMSI